MGDMKITIALEEEKKREITMMVLFRSICKFN